MPLFRYWQLAFNGQPSDIAWLHLSGSGVWLAIIIVLLALIGISLGAIILTKKDKKRSYQITIAVIGIFLLILTPIFARRDQRYYGGVPVFNHTASEVCAIAEDGDLVLIDAYLKPFWWFYLNFGCSGPDWVGLPYIRETAIGKEQFYPRTAELTILIHAKLDDGNQVFLIQSPQVQSPSYSDKLEELGFGLVRKIAASNQVLEFFTVE